MAKQYAIVVDAGSSGSRAHIYEYEIDATSPNSLPAISEISASKVKPGLSSYSKNVKSLWGKHLEPLIKQAEEVVPKNHHSRTPIFVQATAGMRLLKPKYRKKILQETCSMLKSKTKFLVNSCEDHVDVIDGDTEGIYGWLALNYLNGKLSSDSKPYGFMDMGGASTQLAFSPTNQQDLADHSDDMYQVSLRQNNGALIQWPVFVSSWLGFGANEARNRQLSSLLNALPKGVDYDLDGDGKGDVTDPCSPYGMEIEFEYDDKVYSITGSGEYETCIKSIFPLLLKNMKCTKEPCMFNGVHGPKMDWTKEKIVGVSEYWYTANDVFNLGGSYDYQKFELATKDFCNTNWSQLVTNFEKGLYGEQLTLDLLRTSCFKASWIINVLHEGFDLPRLGIDDDSDGNEPMFKSIKDVNDNELSWTLGKMIMYASDRVKGTGQVGIIPGESIKLPPNENIWHDDDGDKYHSMPKNLKDDSEIGASWLFSMLLIITIGTFGYFYLLKRYGGLRKFLKRIKQYRPVTEEWIDLEEGRQMRTSTPGNDTLRTRSALNLQDGLDRN